MIIEEDEYSVKFDNIPDYAVGYMAYGEPDALSDEDIKNIDDFMEKHNLDSLSEISDSTSFVNKPAFGLATNCFDWAIFTKRHNELIPYVSLHGGFNKEDNEKIEFMINNTKIKLEKKGNKNPSDNEIIDAIASSRNKKEEELPYRSFIYHCSNSEGNMTPEKWQKWYENRVIEGCKNNRSFSFEENLFGEITHNSDYWKAHIDARPAFALIEMATLLKLCKENVSDEIAKKDAYYKKGCGKAASVLNDIKQFSFNPKAFDSVIAEYKKLDEKYNSFNNEKFEKENVTGHDEKFRYMLLSRMQSDCEYYLGNGNKNAKNLWAGEETQHIKNMVSLYNSFPSHRKPEWLTIEKLDDYSKKLTGKSLEENNFKEIISKNYTEGILSNNSIRIAADICLSDTRNEPYFYGITHEGLRALKEDNDNIREIVLKNIDTILNETDSSHNKTDTNLIMDSMIDKWYYTNHPTQTAKEPGYISNIQHLDSEKENGYANILGYNEILGMWGIYSKSENVFAPYNDYNDAKENFSLLESYDNTDSKEYKDLLKQRDYLKVSNQVFERNVDSITNNKKQEIEKKLSDNINENEKKQILLHSESNAKEQIKECNNNINDNGNKGKRK